MGSVRLTMRVVLPVAMLCAISCVSVPTDTNGDDEVIFDSKITNNVKINTVPADLAQPRRPSYQPIPPNFSPGPRNSPSSDGTDGTGGTASPTPSPSPTPTPSPIVLETPSWTSSLITGDTAGAAADGDGKATVIGGVNTAGFGLGFDNTKLFFIDKTTGAMRSVLMAAPHTSATVVTDANLTNAACLAYDQNNHLYYIADPVDHTIKRFSLSSAVPPVISYETIAGQSGVSGYVEGSKAPSKFKSPTSLALLGQKLYVADTGNNCIRLIDLSTSTNDTTLVAGTPTAAAGAPAAGVKSEARTATKFNGVTGLGIGIFNGSYYLFMADTNNHCIRGLNIQNGLPPSVDTIAGFSYTAGNMDGGRDEASFNKPLALYCDTDNVFVGELGNFRLRRINLKATPTTVKTLVGQATAGSAEGDATAAKFSGILGLWGQSVGGKYTVWALDTAATGGGPSIKAVVQP
jgi:hypothetical protein